MPRLSKEKVLSYFLAFVVIWFGTNEILSPERWVAFVPSFLGTGDVLHYLVIGHGVVLILCGLAMLSDFHKRIAAFIVFLMLVDIVVTLISISGLDEVVVRDIGLLGMALALSLKN